MSTVEHSAVDKARNYFELFRLPLSFDVNVDDLAVRYRKLQQQFHPDRMSAGSDTERRIAAQLSADINAGFKVLSDPVNRAGFLLECSGCDLRQLEREPVSEVFLYQQIDLRERLQSLADGDRMAYQQVASETTELFDLYSASFRDSYKQGDLKQAGDAWVHLLYINKLRSEVERDRNSH